MKYEDQPKAELLAGAIASVYRLEPIAPNNRTLLEVQRSTNAIMENVVDMSLENRVTTEEIRMGIRGTRPYKAPVSDEIPNKLLKMLPNKAVVQIYYIIKARRASGLPPVLKGGGDNTY